MPTRRVRDACASPSLQCIGTSATMITEGQAANQRRIVADVATTLFGVAVQPEHVIGETLKRVTDPATVTADALRRHAPEVGAQCGSSARWDLCGGAARKGAPYRNPYLDQAVT